MTRKSSSPRRPRAPPCTRPCTATRMSLPLHMRPHSAPLLLACSLLLLNHLLFHYPFQFLLPLPLGWQHVPFTSNPLLPFGQYVSRIVHLWRPLLMYGCPLSTVWYLLAVCPSSRRPGYALMSSPASLFVFQAPCRLLATTTTLILCVCIPHL
jgi:hypothetical protein